MANAGFQISGMTCAACSARVEKAASGVSGVSSVAVNLLKNSMQLEYDGREETVSAVIDAVEAAGYGARVSGGENRDLKDAQQREGKAAENIAALEAKRVKMRLMVSFIFAIPCSI